MLVIIGADEWGNTDVPGLIDGFRESTQSWRELLLDLNRRSAQRSAGGWRRPRNWRWATARWGSGPRCARSMAGPGCSAAGCTTEGMTAIGPKECPKANVLNAMPKSVQPKAKAQLKDIWIAETKAEAAFDVFIGAYGVKYAKSCSKWRAAKCLIKDRADLLAFYDFPAGHWKHIEPPRLYRRAKLSENCPLWNTNKRRPRSHIHPNSASVRFGCL